MSQKSKRIDKEEEEKVKMLWKTLESRKRLTAAEIFESKTIAKIVEEKPLSFNYSFRESNATLPLNCLLYPQVLVTICRGCDCNRKPELLRPYLERQMVLPILTHPLEEFDSDFADLIVQYPFIGVYTLNFIRDAQIFTSPERQALCPHCYEESANRILKKVSETAGEHKKEAKNLLDKTTFFLLSPAFEQEFQILKEIENAVDQRNLELVTPLTSKACVLHTLRMSQIFEAIPQVSYEYLDYISETIPKMGLSIDTPITEQIEEKEWAVKALNLDYNPSMVVDEYLDIISPRRDKINSLVNEVITKKESGEALSKINDEIWEINREISSSKAIESLSFFTNFVSDNTKILFGMLAGGLIGYTSGSITGCGLGTFGGFVSGMVGELISKRIALKVPKYPKKTLEWLKAKIEGPEERLLSIMLSKDIKIIQTWALRRKLKKK